MHVASPRGRPPGLFVLYRALWQYAAGARGSLLLALGCLLAARLVLLGLPFMAGRALNILQLRGAAGIGAAALWLAAIIGLTLLSWAFHGPGRYFERHVALSLRQRLSGDLVEKLVHLPLSWHESQHSGATAHRVQQSVDALAGFAGSQYVYLSSLVALVGPLAALWLLRPVLGATAIVGLVVMAFATRGFDRRMVRLAHAENEAERRYAATLLDCLGNITTLFALRQARAVAALMRQRLSQVFDPVRRSIVLNELKWFWVDLASRLLSCVLVGLYAWLVTREPRLDNGAAPALLLGSLYMVWEYAQQAGGVVTDIASHLQGFARLQADYASSAVVRNTPPASHLLDAATDDATLRDWQTLQLRDLRFRHPASRAAGPDVDVARLSLQRGRRYALVGASGSGKSTLLRLLAGLYAADHITLMLDTTTMTNRIDAARRLRASATLIPQDAEVYEGTVAENLGLCESLQGLPSPERFPRALQVAQTGDFVPISAAGLASRVVERGANWSGGQRSRLALARGVLAAEGSALLLLDEPTAALDASTEASVCDALFAEFPDACLISSVHRINLLERFDEVILMGGGKVLAQGPTTELQRYSAEFRALLSAFAGASRH